MTIYTSKRKLFKINFEKIFVLSIGCIALISLAATDCRAFKPDQQHDPISQKALSLYQECSVRVIPDELKEIFIRAAVDEDNISLERLTNWHFYNNGKRVGTYYLMFYGANDRIFQELLTRLENLLESKKSRPEEIYKIAGRLAHHIQEMSAPAHVMPIYHVGEDKLEHFISTVIPAENKSEICKILKEPVLLPSDIFERAAQNTLKAVASPVIFDSDKTVEDETWMKFWGGSKDKDLEGFKTYGAYGNVFGLIPPCPSQVCRLYDKSTYDRFYNDCYMRAVTDTIRLLFYIDKKTRSLAH